MALVNNAYKTTMNATSEGNLVAEVHDQLFHIGEPSEAPLVAAMGGMTYEKGQSNPKEIKGKIGTEELQNIEYKVIEKDPRSRSGIASAAVASTTTQTIPVVSNENFRVNDVIKNVTQYTGEVAYVIAVNSNGIEITVRRNLGGTAFQIAANDVFQVVGYACKQGGAKAQIKMQLAAPRTRYAQIFKTAYGISGTAAAVAVETKSINIEDEETNQALVDHRKDLAFSFWWNPGADSSTDAGSNVVYISRGCIAELTAVGQSLAYTTLDENYFFTTFAEKAFEYGPSRKQFAVDSRMKSIVNSFSRVKQISQAYDTKYGVRITEIETSHGILEMFTDGALNRFIPESKRGIGCVLDFEMIKFRPLRTRNTQVIAKTQTPGDDVMESLVQTEAGWSIRTLKHHLLLMAA